MAKRRSDKEIVDMLVSVTECSTLNGDCQFANVCERTETCCAKMWASWLKNEDKKKDTLSEKEMEEEMAKDKAKLEKINETLKPFYITTINYGEYILGLSTNGVYKQDLFNLFATSIGEKPKNSFGLYSHGSGHEWERIFRRVSCGKAGYEKVSFDSEAGGFYCYCKDLDTLVTLAQEFKNVCDNDKEFYQWIKKANE